MGNVLSFVFASFYVVSSYYIYGNFIYPMLIRNYRKGLDINFDYFKKDIIYLGSMILGWLILMCWWIGYLFTFLIVKKIGGTEAVSVACLNISGSVLVLSVLATGWPKLIGSFLLRR